jgi:HAD superfamily hydrolase (TIGR01484 family)
MPERLLVCTDLDRTLLPNGPEPESPTARARFTMLVADPRVTLAYVSGRHRALVEQAIFNYRLPVPDFVVGDVGTTIYRVGTEQAWTRLTAWEDEFASDWAGRTHADLKAMLHDLSALQLQEISKQNEYKLSYYVPLQSDRDALSAVIRHRLAGAGIHATLIWSTDEPTGIGLLDILPARASKLHAVKALMRMNGFDDGNTVFCGDSGNDIEVLASPVPAVLVANGHADVKELARRLADETGCGDRLYIAQGGFMDMNGNYSAGILEGIAHYHPETRGWMQATAEEDPA